jgi:hypothetical protein
MTIHLGSYQESPASGLHNTLLTFQHRQSVGSLSSCVACVLADDTRFVGLS